MAVQGFLAAENLDAAMRAAAAVDSAEAKLRAYATILKAYAKMKNPSAGAAEKRLVARERRLDSRY